PQRLQQSAVFTQDVSGTLSSFFQQSTDGTIEGVFLALRQVGAALAFVLVGHKASDTHVWPTQAVYLDQLAGDGRGRLQVTEGAHRQVAQKQRLGPASAQSDADGVKVLVARADIAVGGVLMANVAERPGVVALDGDALDGRGVREKQRADSVPRL